MTTLLFSLALVVLTVALIAMSMTVNRLSEEIDELKEHLAFVVTAIDGNSYIIGARETPFPVVKLTNSFGNADGDGAGFIYEITHKAIKSLVPYHK